MRKRLHVGAAQIFSTGPVAETLRRIDGQARIAAAAGVEVLLFAEGTLHGYDYDITPGALAAAAETVDGASCQRVHEIASRHGITLLVGFFERDGDACYNTHAVIAPGGLLGVQRKHCLTAGELKAGFSPGPRARTVFTFNGVRTAILICADTGIAGRYELLREHEVQYTFIPTGGGGKFRDYLHEADLATEEGLKRYVENRPRVFNTDAVVAEVREHRLGWTTCNAMGRAGANTCHQGHSMIVDNNGLMRAQMPGTIVLEHQEDALIHATLTFGETV